MMLMFKQPQKYNENHTHGILWQLKLLLNERAKVYLAF